MGDARVSSERATHDAAMREGTLSDREMEREKRLGGKAPRANEC